MNASCNSTRGRRSKRGTAFAILSLLTACGFVHDETLVARYKLVAVDADGQMSMCWALDNGSCVGDAFPDETLFAAGYNDKYVVLGRHPNESKKQIVEYYYIIRDQKTEDLESGAPYGRVRGPFDQKQFQALKVRLGFPEFSRKFDNL